MPYKIKGNIKMKKLVFFSLILLSGCAFSGCSNASRAQEILDHQGYTKCSMLGADTFGCSGDTWTCDKFICNDIKGKPVSGDVDCGDGCIVRLN
jgi:hypothetical protein